MNALKLSTVLALLIFAEIGWADPLDTWTWRNPIPPPLRLLGITYGSGQFVAVGESGIIVTSANGVNWAQRQSGTANLLCGIAYGNGQFVVVGGRGTILTSADGVSWVRRRSGSQYWLNGIAFGSGQFVAVGDYSVGPEGLVDGILTSADGVNWLVRQAGTEDYLRSIAYGNGQFVAVGDAYDGSVTIVTSADGVNWVQRQSGTTNALRGVAYGKGQFVAVGGHVEDIFASDFLDVGSIVTSGDGTNWVLRLSGIHNGLRSIAYGNGQFVAMGDGGTTLTSADGVNWIQRDNLGISGLGPTAITYGNGHFVVVGNQGMILESGSIISLSIPRNAGTGPLTLSVEGPTGLDYTIQVSSDLISWRNWTNFTTAQPTGVIFDVLHAGPDRAFFRAIAR